MSEFRSILRFLLIEIHGGPKKIKKSGFLGIPDVYFHNNSNYKYNPRKQSSVVF